MFSCHIMSLFAVMYPRFWPPIFEGPFRVFVVFYGLNVTDFTFTCTVQYLGDDGAMFDVVLTFDGVRDESTLKTTTPSGKTVVFNSTEFQGHFGTEVNTVFYSTLCVTIVIVVAVVIRISSSQSYTLQIEVRTRTLCAW